jgi:hypothetical protein
MFDRCIRSHVTSKHNTLWKNKLLRERKQRPFKCSSDSVKGYSNANTEACCWTLYQDPSTSFLHKNFMCTYISSTKATCLVHHNFLAFTYLSKPGDQYEPCSPCYTMFCSLVSLRQLIFGPICTVTFLQVAQPKPCIHFYHLPYTAHAASAPHPWFIQPSQYLQVGDIMELWREMILQHLFTSLITTFILWCTLSTVTFCHMHNDDECLC